jgi:multicomponent Na+:H+ antiporter subunit E
VSGAFFFSLGFWLLLTGDLSWTNIAIGVTGSSIVSKFQVHRITILQFARLSVKALLALPLAYAQALKIMILPHRHERVNWHILPPGASYWDIYEKVFLITLTPRTLAEDVEDDRKIKVHSIERRSE